MSSHKVSKFRGPGSRRPRNAYDRQLDLICPSEEQIHQIKGARNALRDVVNNCSKHLHVSFAILILRDKGISLRSESAEAPLANSYKLAQELDKRLADWQATANKRAVEGFDALTDVSEFEALVACKCMATPVVVDEDRMEGVLLFAKNPECPDFGKHERTLLQAIAANISSIVEARFDTLTGLVNCNEFEYLVEKSMNASRSKNADHSILHLNLDELQSVDESLGRAARDEAIRQVGLLLAGEMEDIGPVARIGEDEFGIFVADCLADRGWCIGQDIRRAISDLSIMWADRPIKLTASIGVSQLSAKSETIESALAAANIACAVAKDRGRDRVAIYRHTDALMLHGRERMQGVESVQQALRNEEHQTAAPETSISGKQAEKTKLISITRPKEKLFIGPDQRYRLEKVIGSGGAGVVHEGYDTVLERPVALKQLFSNLVQDAEHMERFRQEARALASLSHPHIVPIYDLLEESGCFWIVMEILSGGSLSERIHESTAICIMDSVEIACCIAEGLGYAHSEGVVHRDVKPMNVLFSANGTPKLTDFGAAKFAESAVQTQEGLILGSPAYMSPEQSAGETVDKRSDIYSLGISLYQMLTGKVPFLGKSTGQILAQHITQAPQPPSELNKKISEPLEQVIHTMLTKKPDDRFQDTHSLITALRQSIPATAV